MRVTCHQAGWLFCLLAVCLLSDQASAEQVQVSKEIQASRTSQLQTAINTLYEKQPKAQYVQLTVSAALGSNRVLVDSPLSIPTHWAAVVKLVGRASHRTGKLVELFCSSRLSDNHLRQATVLGSSVLTVSSLVNLTLEGIAIRGCAAPAPPVLVTSSASLHLLHVQLVNNSNTGALAADALTAGSGNGGGVQCFGCQQLLFEWVHATSNNASGSGGVIHIQNSPGGLIVRDSEFIRNVATVSGGTIRAVDADVAVEGSLFDRSHCKSHADDSCTGGALSLDSTSGAASTLMASNVSFKECSAGYDAGAIMLKDSHAHLQSVTGTDCSSTGGGGGFLSFKVTAKQLPKLVMVDGIFEGNRALYAGGALSIFGGIATLTNCTMHSNEVTEGAYGGAISHEGPGSLNLINCVLMNNNADFHGGAVYATRADSNVTVTNTSVVGNKAGRFGGGIFCNNVACKLLGCSLINNSAVAAGGGMYVQAAASLHVNNCAVLGNEAQRSAGLHISSVFQVQIAHSTFEANHAQQDAGAAFLSQCPDTRITSSTFAKNKAASGAGLSTYVCQSLSISNTSFDSNQAVAGAVSIDTHAEGVPVFLTAVGEIAVAGRGAAIAASHVGMALEGVLFSHNSADVSGGAMLLQQSHMRAANCTWSRNRALSGAGGGMLMEAGSGMELLQTTFTSNTATSGGAAMILLPADATMTVVMNDTVLEGNTAVEGTGGAVSATGRITFLTSRCNFSNNVASSSGGGLFCQNCMLLRLTASTAAGNAGAGSGGALCCLSCAQLEVQDVSAYGNVALEGGSITVSGLTRTSSIISSRFFNNTATADHDLLPALLRLPGLSRDSRIGSSWTSTCQAAPGAGGAICLHHCAAVRVSDSKFTSNTAATGGALFQQRCTSNQAASNASPRGTSRRSLHSTPGSPAKGILDFQHSLFIANEAVGGGGGAVFTADASLVLFDGAPPSASLVQQLAANNSAVGEAGYGNGLASEPSSVSVSSDWSTLQLQAVPEAAAAATAQSAELPGYSAMSMSGIRGRSALRVQTNRLTRLTVKVLDAFGSVVLAVDDKRALTLRLSSGLAAAGSATGNGTRAPQHLCSSIPAQCAQQCVSPAADGQADCNSGSTPPHGTAAAHSSCVTACLSGATTVVFKQGVAVFDSLRFQARPNTSWLLHMQPQGIASLPPLQVPLQVLFCGAGEVVHAADGTCQPCLSHQYSFNPATGCSSCPQPGGNCTNGLLTPLPGFWHSHPRSNQFHACPSPTTCTPTSPAALLGLQRQMRPALDAADLLFVSDYSQAQCAAGYAGKLCGACDRLGGFGRGPGGHCVRCPGSFWQSLLAWLSVRLLDITVVSSMVVVWCQAAPQMVRVAEQSGGHVWFRLTKASIWQLYIMSYLAWSQLVALVINGSAAGWQLQPWARGLASALLLTPQSTWQWVGLDCLLTTARARPVSLGLLKTFLEVCYPVFLAPATMLVAVPLMSRLKRRERSPASSLVLLPPVLHQDLDPNQLVVGGNHMSEAGSVRQPLSAAQAATAPPSAAAAGPAAPASEVSQVKDCTQMWTSARPLADAKLAGSNGRSCSSRWNMLGMGPYFRSAGGNMQLSGSNDVPLQFVTCQAMSVPSAALYCSLSYCFTSICQASVAAFTCKHLDHGDSNPSLGVVLAAVGFYWNADLAQQCGSGQHTAALAISVLIGIPAVVLLLLWNLAAAASFRLSLPQMRAAPPPPAAVSAAAAAAAAFRGTGIACGRELLLTSCLPGRSAVQRLLKHRVFMAAGSLLGPALRPAAWGWWCVELCGRLIVAVVAVATSLSVNSAVQMLMIQTAVASLQLVHLLCQPEAWAWFKYINALGHALLHSVCIMTVVISSGASTSSVELDGPAAALVFGLWVCGCCLVFLCALVVGCCKAAANSVSCAVLSLNDVE